MGWDDGTPYLQRMADGVYAYVQPDGGWMVNNCGIVVDGANSAILVATTSTDRRNRAFLPAVSDLGVTTPKAWAETERFVGNGGGRRDRRGWSSMAGLVTIDFRHRSVWEGRSDPATTTRAS